MWDNTKATFEMVELIGYTAIVNYIEDCFFFCHWSELQINLPEVEAIVIP